MNNYQYILTIEYFLLNKMDLTSDPHNREKSQIHYARLKKPAKKDYMLYDFHIQDTLEKVKL